jgi:hypothetical protein
MTASNALDRMCSVCGAPPGDQCRDLATGLFVTTHGARFSTAAPR